MNKTETIKTLIKNTNISTKSFAEKAGIPYTTLRSMLERGIDNASVNNVIKVCAALNISLDNLYNIAQSTPLSNDEAELIADYNKLNLTGKSEARKRVSELTQINIYKLQDEIFDNSHIGMAAHDDFASDPNEQKLMKEDLDEL